MKATTFFTCICCLVATSLFSQNNIQQTLSVNTDGSAAAASAQLDVQATDKGMLVPRMTTAQRTAIASPATGLLVFDTTTGGFWFYNSAGWTNLSTPKTLADADGDTKIEVEENPNEDVIRFDLGGTEYMVLRKNASNFARLELLGSNIFIGKDAGKENNIGIFNTTTGTSSLASNTAGTSNTATGYTALFSNTTGSFNTSLGRSSLYSNTTGSNNIATGQIALYSNTEGSDNTAIGFGAIQANKANSRSTAMGYRAMYYADDRTTGRETYNTAVGYEALKGSSTAANNSGRYNTAIGDEALLSNTAGNSNTANGYQALRSNTTGFQNTANGESALSSNTNGTQNTAIGMQALLANTTGDNNTAMGHSAADAGSGHAQCTAVGVNTDVGTAANSYTNATAIGYDANTAANNYVRIGNTSVTSIGGQVGWSNYSDGRFKRNILENVAGLDFITRLRPVTYQWDIPALNHFIPNADEDSTEWAGKYDIEQVRFSGFVAQEVEAAAREAGFDFSGVDKPQNETTPYALRYAEFVVPLVKAVQEQQAEIEQLKTENERLKNVESQLENITAALQNAGIAVEN